MFLPRLYVPAESCLVKVAQVFRHQHCEALAKHLCNLVAEHALGCGIDEDYRTLFINCDDGVRGRLREGAKSVLALSERIHPRCAITIQRNNGRNDQRGRERYEPPPPPDRRQYREIKSSR